MHLSSDMKNIKIKIVVSIYINDFYGAIENHIVETQILFYNDASDIHIYLDKIIYKPAMYYKNIFYDDVINRLANILITRYHECQSKSPSKSKVNNERFDAILSETNFYKIFDVPKEATILEIKKAYHKLTLSYHPDKNQTEKAAAIFKKVSDAYTTLNNPKQRNIYDYNIIKNKEPKEESEIRIKRQTMEETALRERSIIVSSNRYNESLNQKMAAAKKEKAAKEAKEQATREAMKKNSEIRAKNKERRTARMQTVKDFLLPIRMFTRKNKKDISQKEVGPYNHPIRLKRATRIYNPSVVPTTTEGLYINNNKFKY